jgi:hypothetical protein
VKFVTSFAFHGIKFTAKKEAKPPVDSALGWAKEVLQILVRFYY